VQGLKILSLLVLAILVASTVSSAIRAEAQTPSGSKAASNWEYINHDSWGSNYSPQDEINKENVKDLEIRWIFPFPEAATFARNQPGVVPFEGAITPPLIVNGTVYVASNMRNVYSFDLKTGQMNWVNVYNYDWNEGRVRLQESGVATPHIHGLQYVDGKLYTSNLNCSIRAVDASSGSLAFEINDICSNVQGNRYSWPLYQGPGKFGSPSHPGGIYRKENVIVAGFTGAGAGWGGGRTFVDGYDLNQNPPKQLWRTFLQPPAEGDPEWAIKACNNAVAGWYFSYKAWKQEGKLGINCRDVPRENVINDWGVPKHYASAVSAIWGQMAVDEETGIVYFATGNQGGWPNQTYTVGPNLYAATIIAIKAKTGQIVWWYQTVVRDMVEGDTAWNTILTKIKINGIEKKVIIKTTTTGLIWALDATNGEPIWIFEPPILKSRKDPDGVIRGRSAGIPCIGCDPLTQDGYWNDIRSRFDMQEKKWLNYPNVDWFYWIPSRAGESDISLNPETNTIYVPVARGVDLAVKAGAFTGGAGLHGTPGTSRGLAQAKNVTIYAIDALTGNIKWTNFIDGVAYRGGVMSSGGVLYIPAADGNLYMFDADTGQLIYKRFFGTSLVVLPTIGKTADGKSRLMVITGGREAAIIGGITPQNVPGALMSFGLPDNYVPKPVQKEVPKEIPKEVAKEASKEVGKEVPKEVRGEIQQNQADPVLYMVAGVAIAVIAVVLVIKARTKK
jgi:outer membrane protein assembly factor BamB